MEGDQIDRRTEYVKTRGGCQADSNGSVPFCLSELPAHGVISPPLFKKWVDVGVGASVAHCGCLVCMVEQDAEDAAVEQVEVPGVLVLGEVVAVDGVELPAEDGADAVDASREVGVVEDHPDELVRELVLALEVDGAVDRVVDRKADGRELRVEAGVQRTAEERELIAVRLAHGREDRVLSQEAVAVDGERELHQLPLLFGVELHVVLLGLRQGAVGVERVVLAARLDRRGCGGSLLGSRGRSLHDVELATPLEGDEKHQHAERKRFSVDREILEHGGETFLVKIPHTLWTTSST